MKRNNYSRHNIEAVTFTCERCRQVFLKTDETIKYHNIDKLCKSEQLLKKEQHIKRNQK